MIKVIINADDLGLNTVVNKAIGSALKNGYITSSTILANSNTWDEIHQIVSENSDASFGVHLNLTQGVSLSQNKILQKYQITDSGNNFTNWRERNIEFNTELLEAIFDEWDKQMHSVIVEHGIPITHIDGHHHIHTTDALQPILIRLIQKYNIGAARNKYVKPVSFLFKKKKGKTRTQIRTNNHNMQLSNERKTKKQGVLVRIANFLNTMIQQKRWTLRLKKYVSITQYFDSYEGFYNDLSNGCVAPNNCIIELMCHPGHDRYMKEYKLIEANAIQKIGLKIELINFKNILK